MEKTDTDTRIQQVAATISTFVLAMVLFPDVQRKAQEEIDRVVGPGRIPSFSDREHLSYLAAVYKELLRWHVIGPMGAFLYPNPPAPLHVGRLISQGFHIQQLKTIGTEIISFPKVH
jgi:cytochrome P450